MTAPAPLLLGEAAAAAALGICPRKLRALRTAGDIDYILIGRRVLYSMADLTRFVEGHRQCAFTSAPAHHIGGSRPASGVVDFAAARAARGGGRRNK